mgnify:CR=1 FL=1
MKTFEEWQADVYGGNITAEQANDELRLAYDYYLDTEKLRNENKGIRHRLSQMRGNKGICLEFDGKDMTDVYDLQKELAEKDIIINFLKKELMHKMSYRQVMKRQYRELKQQMEADNERHTKMYADLVGRQHKPTNCPKQGNKES